MAKTISRAPNGDGDDSVRLFDPRVTTDGLESKGPCALTCHSFRAGSASDRCSTPRWRLGLGSSELPSLFSSSACSAFSAVRNQLQPCLALVVIVRRRGSTTCRCASVVLGLFQGSFFGVPRDLPSASPVMGTKRTGIRSVLFSLPSLDLVTSTSF